MGVGEVRKGVQLHLLGKSITNVFNFYCGSRRKTSGTTNVVQGSISRRTTIHSKLCSETKGGAGNLQVRCPVLFGLL